MPQVTLIGEPSNGALFDVLPKELPNGWDFGLSMRFIWIWQIKATKSTEFNVQIKSIKKSG